MQPGLPELDAGLTSTPTKAASSEGFKKELGESGAEVEEQGEVEGGGDGSAASGELLVSWMVWAVDWSAHSSPHQVKVEVSVDGLPEDQEALQVGGYFV